MPPMARRWRSPTVSPWPSRRSSNTRWWRRGCTEVIPSSPALAGPALLPVLFVARHELQSRVSWLSLQLKADPPGAAARPVARLRVSLSAARSTGDYLQLRALDAVTLVQRLREQSTAIQ